MSSGNRGEDVPPPPPAPPPLPHELTAEWTVRAQLTFARGGEPVQREYSTQDAVHPVRVVYKWCTPCEEHEPEQEKVSSAEEKVLRSLLILPHVAGNNCHKLSQHQLIGHNLCGLRLWQSTSVTRGTASTLGDRRRDSSGLWHTLPEHLQHTRLGCGRLLATTGDGNDDGAK